MTRSHFTRTARNGEGSALEGCSVRVLNADRSALTQPLYETSTASTAMDNPWVSEDGTVDFYLDNAQIVAIGVTPAGGGAETFFEDQMVGVVPFAGLTLTVKRGADGTYGPRPFPERADVIVRWRGLTSPPKDSTHARGNDVWERADIEVTP